VDDGQTEQCSLPSTSLVSPSLSAGAGQSHAAGRAAVPAALLLIPTAILIPGQPKSLRSLKTFVSEMLICLCPMFIFAEI